MKMTSAQANKKLKQMNAELSLLIRTEQKSCVFRAAVGENVDEIRPEYDYHHTQLAIDTLNRKIRKLKHSINVFNTITEIPDHHCTIDEALVLIPQLTQKTNKLSKMQSRLPRERVEDVYRTSIIDYVITNYDRNDAAADYQNTQEELAELQTALDTVNNTVEYDFDIEES